MTSWPVLPPWSSRTTTSAISSGVTNSICSPVVMAAELLEGEDAVLPGVDEDVLEVSRPWPRPRDGSSDRKREPGTRASASSRSTSTRGTGRPPRSTSP